MRDLAKKNLASYRKIEVTGKRSTREKLLAYLAIAAEEANSSSFTIPFDRQELADYLEVDRSGLSQEISKLTREGVLSAKKSTFHLY
jgi:CRP-like cAMP-binding protein